MDLQQYSELRARIARLGLTQSGLARRMKQLGDDRCKKNILRSIQRMIAGDARVSGEMRALIGLLEETKAAGVSHADVLSQNVEVAEEEEHDADI